ncbi:fungal-specific transcription factor domain-containing protein [Trichoderma citrinoviride]|uniref:Fungal-specific transcription factor domain-containing protein n=1 Tax=Trichoderma citrinoviride TaxID=58853 RepID=A0A2T4B7F0_9HYPO|nr:fungal-specific transcription factor domain-containing protein [Trichoderma citrinoviride]PTB65256.1 fungal-specific transcription factor domain-containing protein [Trichoderma citrinoviride]
MDGVRSNAIDPSPIRYATGAGTTIWPAHLTGFGAERRRPNGCGRSSTESIVKRLERIEQGIARAKAIKQSAQAPPIAPPAAPPCPVASPVASPDASSIYQRKITLGRCTICRHSQSSSSSRQLGATPLGQVWFSGQKFAAVCSRNGIPHFTALGEQWIYSRTGLWPRFYNEDIASPSDQPPSYASPFRLPNGQMKQTQLETLPDRSITLALLDEFTKSEFRLIFPVVDRELFEETIRLAYDSSDDNLTIHAIGSKACVLAFLSVAGHHFRDLEIAKSFDADACARRAQLMISDFVEDASLTTLQVMVMLLLNETLCGHLQAASMYHAIACRTVCVLGGHTLACESPTDRKLTVQELVERQIRMLFWVCYLFDKDMALRNGQPPIISDEFCDLTLPQEYLENRFSSKALSAMSASQRPFLPSDLRLSLLKSKTVSALYSAGSLRKSDAELLRTIRELDEELENWRASIPPEYAPVLSVSKHVKLSDTLNKSTSMLHIELHLDYHYLLNIIHCASGRCVVDWSESGKEMIFGLQSSLDLSVEASRSTLIYLRETAHRLAGEAFWVFIFYPISALLSIFFNILRNPQHEYACQDVELLASATKVIRSMPIHRVTTHELEYLRKMDYFIEELTRLSRAAIDKARLEHGAVGQ